MQAATTEGRRRPGRPRKGETRGAQQMKDLHFQVSPDGAAVIDRLAKLLGVSQGAAIEHAARLAADKLCNAA